ncbi:MAG TPA: hypothetical protein V6D27_08180, partial [Vampirovibrionales bacterium]
PPVEQEKLAQLIPNAQLGWLNSPHGHDAFLIDMEELNAMVVNFRKSLDWNATHRDRSHLSRIWRVDN